MTIKWKSILIVLVKLKDMCIPLFCVVALSTTALRIISPPQSIITAFGDANTAWLWAVGCLIAYSMVVVGSALKKDKFQQDKEDRKNLESGKVRGDLWLYFEYPGLIASSILTMVYAIALIVVIGYNGFVAAFFILAIGIYFFLRWAILWVSLLLARKKIVINKGS